MTLFRKAAVSLAALSMIAAPVAASAAPTFDTARATSNGDGQSKLEGNSSWLIGLVGLLAGIAAIIVVSNNNDDNDNPVSP